MSKAKFAAAKELIEEHKYQLARALLNTMDDPKAQAWLHKIDELDPPYAPTRQEYAAPGSSYAPPEHQAYTPPPSPYAPPSGYQSAITPQATRYKPPPTQMQETEADRYYRRKNRASRFRRFGSGLNMLGLSAFSFAAFVFFGVYSGFGIMSVALLVLTAVGLIGGLLLMFKREL